MIAELQVGESEMVIEARCCLTDRA